MNILLLDVDGVLVEDRGYRAGVIATVSHYSRLMGAGDADLDEAALDLFHAHGYTNEWDICPLAIGILIVEALIFASPEPLTPKVLLKLLDGEPKEDVEAAIAALREAMKGDDKADIEAKTQALTEASGKIAERA